MASSILHPESAQTTPAIDPKLFEAAGEMMSLAPDHPEVVKRVTNEERDRHVMGYAAGAVSAAMDALAALDAVDLAALMDNPGSSSLLERGTADRLLRIARRNLRAAVGSVDHPGYDRFCDAIAAHGLCIYDD